MNKRAKRPGAAVRFAALAALLSFLGALSFPQQLPTTQQPATPVAQAAVPTSAAAPAGAAAQSSPTAIPTDPADKWRVGVTRFQGTDLSPDNAYLEESLALQVFDAISGADTHEYSEQELAAYRAKLVQDAIRSEETHLVSLYDQRSSLFYQAGLAQGTAPGTTTPAGFAPAAPAPAATPAATNPLAPPVSPTPATPPAAGTQPAAAPQPAPAPVVGQGATTSPFAAIDASITASTTRIAFLRSLDASTISVPDDKPIYFATPAAGGSASASPAAPGPAAPGPTAPGPTAPVPATTNPATPGPTTASSAPVGAVTAASGGAAASAATSGTAAAAGIASSAAPAGTAGGTSAGVTAAATAASPPSAAAPAALQGEQLFPYPPLTPAIEARSLSLDFLVYGTITEVEGYLLLTIDAYDTSLDTTVYSYHTAFSPSGAPNALSEPIGAITAEVLGREWSQLRLTVKPPGALVYIDGVFYGIGDTEIRLLRAGIHDIRVRAPGYVDETQTVDFNPRNLRELSISLSKREAPTIVISTLPAGADVYVDAQWMGTTPLLIDRPDSSAAVTVHKDKYTDLRFPLLPTSPPSLDLRLTPELFNKNDYASSLRNRFYSSFGSFALSLILPVAAFGLYQDYEPIYFESASGSNEEKRLLNLATIWYYSFLGGSFVSAALFTNMVIDIVDYLGASR